MKFVFLSICFFSFYLQAAAYDYNNMPFLDQNIKVGLGMSYSKLEASSDVGNYFLLSQANPRLDISYSSAIVDSFRHKFAFSIIEELFRPENDALYVKTHEGQGSASLSWQPIWVADSKAWARSLKFAIKNSSVISELPNPFDVRGDIANRYSAEAGIGFTWYGNTVSKFPLALDAEVLYSQTLLDRSKISYYNGYVYRFGLDFEFKKKTLLQGWGFRGFYSFEDLRNEYNHAVDKEIGIVLNRSISF